MSKDLGLGLLPRAWIGPVGQTMTHEIYLAWAQEYPADAQHFTQLYDRAALDAAAASERNRLVAKLQDDMVRFEAWRQQGDALMANKKFGAMFSLGAWWADRPWRNTTDEPSRSAASDSI
jgi:hypothetical protein